MSIVIKGIDAPARCTNCLFEIACDCLFKHIIGRSKNAPFFWECPIEEYYEPQKGKWKEGTIHDGIYEREGVICSVCGDEFDETYNYYPSCGAKMEE
jgi:hypothetical protein